MEPVTNDDVVRTCAIQAVRIERLVEQNKNLAAILEANNQQIIKLVEEKNEMQQRIEKLQFDLRLVG